MQIHNFALKANQSTTNTKAEGDGLLTPNATTAYVYTQLALKANHANDIYHTTS